MSLLDLVRNPRYKVKAENSLSLIIQTALGSQFKFTVKDCSITGLLGVLEGADLQPASEEITEEVIIPSGKLVFGEEEIALGRLVVQRKLPAESGLSIALSTIDARLPIDTKLSKLLDMDLKSNKSPFDAELSAEGFNMATFAQADFNNTDMFERTRQYSLFFKQFSKSDRFAYGFPRTSMSGARIEIAKLRDGGRTDFLMFGSNDYLSLSCHPEVIQASVEATQKYGVGSTGTAPTAGTTDVHQQLCQTIARMYGKEDAMVFSSGYGANVGIIAGLAREQDLLVADIISHASMQDGMAMSRATTRFYKHNDMAHLEKTLQENRAKHGGCMILTEGLFSMDGTLGNLSEICALAQKYNARTFVDQGHCIGVLGKNGLGTSELTNSTGQLDLIMGLFSKGLGTLGGFVAGPKSVIEWLTVYARSYLFATSFPPANAAATLKSLEIMSREPERRQKLAKNVQHFVKGLNKHGLVLDPTHATPIVPVHIGDESKMGKIFQSMLHDGVFALPVIYPVVSKTRSRFRFSITAQHSISDLDYALFALEKATKSAGVDLVEAARKLHEPKPHDSKKSAA